MKLSAEEFGQHIINAFSEYANVRVARHTPTLVKRKDGVKRAALYIELDGGQSFRVEVEPG